jgi:hypothetical protein
MTTKTRESDAVDVAAMLRQGETDVVAEVRAKFAESLENYRRGVRRMAESGGTLPADEADVVLRACRELDIPAGRLSDDAVTMIRYSRLQATMEEIHKRNAERGERAAQLQAALDAERAAFVPVRVECEQRLREANARLDAAHRAYEKAANERAERIDEQAAEARRLEGIAPHLFGNLEPDQLRRVIHPQHRSMVP